MNNENTEFLSFPEPSLGLFKKQTCFALSSRKTTFFFYLKIFFYIFMVFYFCYTFFFLVKSETSILLKYIDNGYNHEISH
jgi:hypothetical protein